MVLQSEVKKEGSDDSREDYRRIINKPPNPLLLIYFYAIIVQNFDGGNR